MASRLTVYPIPAFSDNYIWCIHDGCHAVVVDPGDATPVFASLAEHGLRLDAVLITHHHPDHTGGIKALKEAIPHLEVIGPNNPRIQGLTSIVSEGDKIDVGHFELPLYVWEVPGHTLDHIAYVHDDMVFCGDTLFSAGCGRLFEGTPAQMYQSLNRLAALPDKTAVYCTHEYTTTNLRFAEAVEPKNEDIQSSITTVEQLRDASLPSIPTSIEVEKRINPFLRAHIEDNWASLAANTQTSIHNAVDAFTAIRAWKDRF